MSPSRIVVVNDSSEFIETTTEILKESGYVVTGHSGEDLTADAIAAMEPDLVILDLVLHRGELASGWELLLLLRSHSALASVPVIVCSADALQLRKRAPELERVANAHVLAKPFTLAEIESVVADALGVAQKEVS